MRIVNARPKHTAIFWVTSRPKRGDWRATLIVKAGYRLVAGGVAVADETGPPVASGDTPSEPDRAPAYASDFVPYKPNADFLVSGMAHAPDTGPVGRCRVSIGIGEHKKSLVAIGDRLWAAGPLGATPGEPAPFVSLPIGYDRAFGGPGNRRNPLGCGTDMRAERPLPNIERLDQLITQPINSPEPAGFGPLPMTWQPRIGKAGNFDGSWLKDRWPWYPKDFDWSFFNAAPADQQFPFFNGNEQLAFENLHPVQALYRSALPGVQARVFVERKVADAGNFEEVPVKLDTVWVDVATERLVLLWRGTVRVSSPRLRDIERICATLEPIDAPASIEVHRDVFAVLADATNADAAAQLAEVQARRKAAEERIADARALAERVRQNAASLTKATGVDAWRRRPGRGDEDPMAALEKGIAALRARDPEKARQIEDHLKHANEVLGAATAQGIGQAAWTRERVIESLAAGASLAKARLDGLDLAGFDFTGVDLHDATLRGTDLRKARLDRANLSGTDLSKSNLASASLVKAELGRANLADAIVDGAVFAGARIDSTIFAKLDLTGADFSGAAGAAPDFTEAVLDGAYFARATLTLAKFIAVRAAGADLSHAALVSADFSAAKAAGIIMEGADLTNLRAGRAADFTDGRFARARATRSVWQQAKLDRADFSRAVLSEAQFPEASLKAANFDRAHLEVATFDDAILVGARLSNAHLMRASFARADLTGANVNGSCLYGAGLLDAVLEAATFRGSFVVQTQLAQ